jgi:spore coat protein SA
MRICHVAPELLPVPPTRGGAIERWIRDAAVRLAGRGHDVHVISRDHGDGVRDQSIDGVRYHHVRIPQFRSGAATVMCGGPWYFAAVGRLLARIVPEIVHHHSRPSGLWLSRWGAPAARQILSLHSMRYGWAFGYGGWDRRLFARGFRACSRVLCVSDFIRRHTVQEFPLTETVATTFYNGVDVATFRPGSGAPIGSPRIVYVGRVEERKGVHVLLDAFERVVNLQAPDVRLLIVGPYSYWNAQPTPFYREVCRRAAANSRIELREPTFNDGALAATYRSGTIAVVPSVFPEALGLTALEAQASGVPVVVSDAGGLPETVAPGESGLVVEHGNAQRLADAMLQLLRDEPRRLAMAASARLWAVTRFSWDVIAGELESIYAEALATSGARR